VKVIAHYSHNGGEAFIKEHYAAELEEIVTAVEAVDIHLLRTKMTKETGGKFKPGQMLFSPSAMNKAIYAGLTPQGWRPARIAVTSPMARGGGLVHTGFREMDGLKNRLGLEIQFGKYAFMGYDVLGKMPIFKKLGLIRAGIELVPTKEIAIGNMSSGVSYFEQITADLELRGASNLDVPLLVLGIGFKVPPAQEALVALNAVTSDE
jgi:Restriction endonuclease BglII